MVSKKKVVTSAGGDASFFDESMLKSHDGKPYAAVNTSKKAKNRNT